jgi:hypothetical protein
VKEDLIWDSQKEVAKRALCSIDRSAFGPGAAGLAVDSSPQNVCDTSAVSRKGFKLVEPIEIVDWDRGN